MRMLVLGAGLQGSACAYDLLRQPGVGRVTLADLKPERMPAFLKPHVGKRLALVKLDVQDGAALRAAMADHAAVQNAAPYYFNLEVSRAAVDAGVHCADLGGNTEIVFQQKKLDAEAKQRNVSVIPDCGLAPGMVNVLAAEGIRRVGDAECVKIYVGGLPQHPEPPLNYQIVYSLEGALDYYTTPSWVPRDAFIATVSPKLTKPEGRDLVALRVEVRGRNGKAVAWQLLDYSDEAHGISAMMRTTGYSLAITGLMQVDGRIATKGVHTPDEAVPFGDYVAELAKRGVEIREL